MARATREAMVVVEAAGYDVVLVETVGVGQSETAVADMVDTFLLLTLARTGDQLQGIKKGVLELADVIAVNKADGPHERDARGAARELAGALRLLRGADAGLDAAGAHLQRARRPTDWTTVWERLVGSTGDSLEATGALAGRRRAPAGRAGPGRWSATGCWRALREHPEVRRLAPDLERQVRDGSLTPTLAAERILAAFTSSS